MHSLDPLSRTSRAGIQVEVFSRGSKYCEETSGLFWCLGEGGGNEEGGCRSWENCLKIVSYERVEDKEVLCEQQVEVL